MNSSRSASLSCRAAARRRAVSGYGERRAPRSRSAMPRRLRPARAARASWEKPAKTRCRRSKLPNVPSPPADSRGSDCILRTLGLLACTICNRPRQTTSAVHATFQHHAGPTAGAAGLAEAAGSPGAPQAVRNPPSAFEVFVFGSKPPHVRGPRQLHVGGSVVVLPQPQCRPQFGAVGAPTSWVSCPTTSR